MDKYQFMSKIKLIQIEETPRHPDIVIFRDAWICCLKS